MGVVVLTYAQFIAAYPQFTTTVSQTAFDTVVYPFAQQYNRNDGGGPVTTSDLQTALLLLMCAHVAQLIYGTPDAAASTAMVGRIASAGQGSVNVATEYPMTTSNAWFAQTQYGASYWQMIRPFRLGVYRAKITPQVQPINGPWALFGWPGFR